ncbi:HNH endonuclease signature motif containing protein [Micropruina sonneratiae]|uniref:HNH endonuclease signature motif containing protein n=1 Tax=Micropruina sonneratiae TaxID=2986940 RepID=UPI002227ECC5|nr:HNH endonuclease signature motif containing protein [Micropruina sp. KQZ13P-5]MCW3157561.1 HNH endonuclease [Micropruina sp. KQZ13P-5]
MKNSFGHHSDQDLVAVLDGVLDALTDERLRLESPQQRLGLAVAAVRVASRVDAWVQQVLAGVEADEVAVRVHGTSTTTWLADAARLTPREARRLIRAGEGLTKFGLVGEAARTGEVSATQAEAITSVLAELPDEFDSAQVAQGEAMMIAFAHTHNSAELRRLTHHLVEVLSPETVEAREAGRLEREARLAHARRFLTLTDDGHGSVLIRGSLPVVDADPFRKLIDSYAAQITRGLEAADPLQATPSASQRRADALCRLVERHQQASLAPCLGGDRPRLVVTLSYDSLLRQARDARAERGPNRIGGPEAAGTVAGSDGGAVGTTGTGQGIAPSVLRRLLCDADILPIILGGPSEVLDVGRTQRLVTAPIRAALNHRDQGCVFPGCNNPPETCHAHHIVPWWNGGTTALHNLVLLCPHHHAIIEPSHNPTTDRWTLTLRPDGISEIRPPRRVDPHQKPRIHARFLTRRRN